MGIVSIEHLDNYRLESVKKALTKGFVNMGLSADNPLNTMIRPGNKVFIKPNWVASRWRESCPHKDNLYCVITHSSVIEAVADFVDEALDGEGEIIIGDNPSIDANFEELMEFTQIRHLEKKYKTKLRILDLRPMICTDLKNYGKKSLMIEQNGDPLGATNVNLGKESMLYGIEPSRFRGVFDERNETIASHSGETQLYTFSKTIYEADVFISIPKMKTHQKVGATLNLKGLVGTISNKNQLVHWQVGYPEINGDEYPSKEAWEKGQHTTVKHRGAWPGNDTIWRMVVDLYKSMLLKKDRKYLSVVDGILAGEGQGPFCPTSKYANTLIMGNNFLDVDVVTARYMGFDPRKINYLNYFLKDFTDEQNMIKVVRNGKIIEDFFENDSMYADFLVMDQWNEIKWKKENL